MSGSPDALSVNQPRLEIRYQPVAHLVEYQRNARTHSEEQVRLIADSIRAFGFVNPVLVDPEGMLIAGHGRVAAARYLGMESVPTVCLAHMTTEQRKAYVLADNQIALRAGWSEALVAEELADLRDCGMDLGLVGFTAEDLAKYLPDVEGIDMPQIAAGARSDFEQITFTLHKTQAEVVRAAVRLSLGMGDFAGSPNDNKNGNALTRICELFAAEIVPADQQG